MGDIKTKVQGIDPNIRARDVRDMASRCGNVYEALTVITKRSKQLAIDLKQELHQKLDEFAVHSETIEEISENKEQIEISKFYEKLPNPVVIAMDEFMAGELHYHFQDRDRRRR